MEKATIIDKAIDAASIVSQITSVPAEELTKYLVAISFVESTFDPKAKNKSSTARGLTQVLINSQRWIEDKLKIPQVPAMHKASKYPKAPVTPYSEDDKMFNPDYALLIGGWYLAYNYKRYNNWHKAITAYHLGSYKSSSQDGIIYKNKVLKAFSELNLGEPLKKSTIKKVPVRILVASGGENLYYFDYY
jgi:hypothetical protein